MRIDGYASAYVPSRTTAPDSSAPVDAAVRHAEEPSRQQQPQAVSDTLQLDSRQTLVRPSAQMHMQQYEARQALHNPPHHYQASQALASYNSTAAFDNQAEEATTVLGLDLYV